MCPDLPEDWQTCPRGKAMANQDSFGSKKDSETHKRRKTTGFRFYHKSYQTNLSFGSENSTPSAVCSLADNSCVLQTWLIRSCTGDFAQARLNTLKEIQRWCTLKSKANSQAIVLHPLANYSVSECDVPPLAVRIASAVLLPNIAPQTEKPLPGSPHTPTTVARPYQGWHVVKKTMIVTGNAALGLKIRGNLGPFG